MLVIILIGLVLLLYLYQLMRNSNWNGQAPPSPPSHPILGHIPTLARIDSSCGSSVWKPGQVEDGESVHAPGQWLPGDEGAPGE